MSALGGLSLCPCAVGLPVDTNELLLLSMLDGTGDPLSSFPGRSLAEASAQVGHPRALRRPARASVVPCTEVQFQAMAWANAERAVTRTVLPAVLGVGYFCGLALHCEPGVHVPHKYTELYTEWLLRVCVCVCVCVRVCWE